MLACTIIARNYLAQARILARSFAEHVPDGRMVVLVLDPDPSAPLTGEPFEVLTPHDIMSPVEFGQMATMYTVVELATAVKPWLLEHLLAQAPAASYFDPDIEFFSDPRFIDRLAREHGAVLTPHAIEPLPRGDALTPGEDVILSAGIYNLGFVSVGGEMGLAVTQWWQSRLRRECIISPTSWRFVDQRWMDLAPAYFAPYILRHPGCNVAWWNLPNRDVREHDGRWTVNGEDLVFFHFSGYDPLKPHLVSKHQGSSPRVLLSERPDLARLFSQYDAKVRAAGHTTYSAIPYGVDEINGLQVDSTMRDLFRTALVEAEDSHGAPPPNPYSDGVPRFVAWLLQPAAGLADARAPSRYLMHLFVNTPELRERFPRVPGPDTAAYEQHVRDILVPQGAVPPELSPAPETQTGGVVTAPTANLQPGVNVIAYFTAESGVGQAARLILSGLEASGVPHATITYDTAPGRSTHEFHDHGIEKAVYDTNLICVNADVILTANHWLGDSLRNHRYRIGLWWWETSTFPEAFNQSFDVVDEVWVGSEFVGDAIRQRTDKPVTVIPMPVVVPAPPGGARSAVGVADNTFLVLYAFDFDSVFARKNPLGALAAYLEAFSPDADCTLLLKSINGHRHLEQLEEIRMAAAERPDVMVVDQYLDADINRGLIAECDCYLSLHRSEGFGLTIAEAMAYARPVVASAYSANLEFMDDSTGYLVPVSATAVPSGADPYEEGTAWAEPNIQVAADLLREVRENPEVARQRGQAAADSIRRHRSPERAGHVMQARLDAIHHERQHDRAASSVPAAPPRESIVRRGTRRIVRPYRSRRQSHDSERLARDSAEKRSRDAIESVSAKTDELTGFMGQLAVDLGGTLSSMADGLTGADHVALESSRALRYMGLAALEARWAAVTNAAIATPSDANLTRYELKAFSQNGEDGVIAEILRRLGIPNGCFVEFGVESGAEGNCVYLAEARSWEGLFIEGDADHFARLERRYRDRDLIATIHALVGPHNINDLIQTAGFADRVDVLSIDIDGNDYWVWKAIDVITPSLVCIEYNAHVPVGETAVQSFQSDLKWNGSSYYGASISALEDLGRHKGYQLVHTDLAGVNAFFVRADKAGAFGDPSRVARRAPNFYLLGDGRAPDPLGRRMLPPWANA
jgi:glycosyltransferase involved in cell wall biosynthesis